MIWANNAFNNKYRNTTSHLKYYHLNRTILRIKLLNKPTKTFTLYELTQYAIDWGTSGESISVIGIVERGLRMLKLQAVCKGKWDQQE